MKRSVLEFLSSFKACRKTISTAILLAVALGSYTNKSIAQSVPAYVSTNSLLGWYPFTVNADNAFGTGKNGVILGPTFATDRFGIPGSALHFNGNLDHVLIDTAFFNVGWSNYTISHWLNADSLINPFNFNNSMETFNTIPHNGIGISSNWGSSGKYNFYANSNPSSVSWDILFQAHSHDSAAAHVWKHIVFSKQNDTIYKLYINGVLDTTCHRSLSAVNHYCRMVFGNIDSSMGDEGFMGKLDDYGLWNRTLAPCEVKRLYLSSAFSYITTQPVNVTTTPGSTIHFSVTDTGSGLTHQWQKDSGTGYTNMTNTGVYSGVTTPTVTITGVTSGMNNNKFRCVVNGSLPCVDTSLFGKIFINTTGLSNNGLSNAFSVVPNPTTGLVTVNGITNANIKVYNSVGQLVREAKNTDKISIADQPTGIYLIKVINEEGVLVYQDKVMKQ